MLLNFLQEFASLSKAEQKVFLFCISHNLCPVAYSGDLQEISAATGLYYQTVRQAMYSIAKLPTLSTLVKYIHSDVSAPKMVSLDALFLDGGSQGEIDWEEIEEHTKDVGICVGPRRNRHGEAGQKDDFSRSFPHSPKQDC